METQNITLSIPKDILKKAKIIAVRRDRSVSSLLTEALVDLVVSEDRYEQARAHHLALLRQPRDLGLGERVPYTREDLHERGK